ncbi:MAG: helix-hairpin-helix domain-containing protein [Deltaproteobacteria bacterium]|nr:helix-hairpin-helix domain-containing protein [Deltaproteobacteria bacterium]MCF8119571.1 helix-hairpin-helix domain-containing protein [Deltaproteobacteria bacterium]
MPSNKTALGVLFLFVLLIAAHFLMRRPSLIEAHQAGTLPRVFVQIDGDVPRPGVYGFDRAPFVKQVLGRAGGAGKLQGEDFLWWDEVPLHSGCCVIIETRASGTDFDIKQMSPYYRVTLNIPLYLNQEVAEAFTAVPGIGPATARAIERERERRGGFDKMDDLLAVRGIGPVLYKKIAAHFTL